MVKYILSIIVCLATSQLVSSTNYTSNSCDSLLITLSFSSDSVRYGDDIDVCITITNVSNSSRTISSHALVELYHSESDNYGYSHAYSFLPPISACQDYYVHLKPNEKYQYKYVLKVSSDFFQEGTNDLSAQYRYWPQNKRDIINGKILLKSKDIALEVKSNSDSCRESQPFCRPVLSPESFSHIEEYIIQNRIRYPQEALEKKLEDRVFVRFAVDSTGHTYGCSVKNGKYEILNEEAIRVVKTMVFPKSSSYEDKTCEKLLTFPVSFTLSHVGGGKKGASAQRVNYDTPVLHVCKKKKDIASLINVRAVHAADWGDGTGHMTAVNKMQMWQKRNGSVYYRLFTMDSARGRYVRTGIQKIYLITRIKRW
ncbi:MAG: energy transducer TonB [Bacteroidales bacterium]|nr:energy transducer TonB [Bacteroidales bacterium]